jgi:hypothetical protein
MSKRYRYLWCLIVAIIVMISPVHAKQITYTFVHC